MRFSRSMTEAAERNALAEAMVASGSFQSLRFRLIQAKKRSTTHRRVPHEADLSGRLSDDLDSDEGGTNGFVAGIARVGK